MTAKNTFNPGGDRFVIGWKERVALPEWGVPRLIAKADTGARTSAIDVAHIEEITADVVRFDMVLSRWARGAGHSNHVTIETPIVRRTIVRSSLGVEHERLFVGTEIEIGGVRKRIEVGLVNRRNMLCRMLLGRAALEPEFLVDPGAHRLLSPPRPRRGDKQNEELT